MSKAQHTQSLYGRLKKNRLAKVAFVYLLVLVIIALLAPVLANHKPLYAIYKGEKLYPAFSSKSKYVIKGEEIDIEHADWKHMKLDKAVWPLVAYSPGLSDIDNANYIAPRGNQVFHNADGTDTAIPVKFRHWLGTGSRGEDTLSGILHGTRISIKVGVLSMLIASFLGILLGALSGYFGDSGLRLNRGGLWGGYIALLPAWFYAFYMRSGVLSESLSNSTVGFIIQLLQCIIMFAALLFGIGWLFSQSLGRVPFFNRQVNVPIDSWITRLIETIISIPGIILIIAIAAITQNFFGVVIVVIGLTGWTGIARLIRAEMLSIRNRDYIIAAKASGVKNFSIIFKHALPNAIQPALVSIVFGMAGAILVESGLSFLGAFAIEDVTWGSLLADGRSNFSAWWLVVFPGLAIFLTVLSLNILGEAIRDEMDVKAR